MLLAVIVDGKKEDTFPDKKNHKYIGYVCNNDDAILSWDKDNWRVTVTTNEPTVCTLKFETFTSRNLIEALKESNDLVTFTHEDTEQTGSNTSTDYRYVGSDPNNYVKFNDELWRIIGVFNTDDGTGNWKERVKLIRSYGVFNKGFGTSNAWETSDINNALNGNYYNSLSNDAKNQITNANWYLGACDSTNLSADEFYQCERGSVVNENVKMNFTGKIGLMYPSDVLFSVTKYSNCNDIGFESYTNHSKCFNGDSTWFDDENRLDSSWLCSWTLTPLKGITIVSFNANALYYYSTESTDSSPITTRPVVYLKSSIETIDGTGEKDNPYILNN